MFMGLMGLIGLIGLMGKRFSAPFQDAEDAEDFEDGVEDSGGVVFGEDEDDYHQGLYNHPAEPLLPPFVG